MPCSQNAPIADSTQNSVISDMPNGHTTFKNELNLLETIKEVFSMAKAKKRKKLVFEGWHASPLKGSFMVTAILGFLISAYYVYPQSLNFGIAFMVIFTLMFIASLISMTKAPISEY